MKRNVNQWERGRSCFILQQFISSLPSRQSGRPSQRCVISIHCPLVHWNVFVWFKHWFWRWVFNSSLPSRQSSSPSHFQFNGTHCPSDWHVNWLLVQLVFTQVVLALWSHINEPFWHSHSWWHVSFFYIIIRVLWG